MTTSALASGTPLRCYSTTVIRRAPSPRGSRRSPEGDRSSSSDPLTGNRIDADRIGAAGFSLGGYTVMAAAGARFSQAEFDRFWDFTGERLHMWATARVPRSTRALCEAEGELFGLATRLATAIRTGYRDTRIKAVFAIAPALGGGFTERGMREVRVPVEIVVGAADAIAPPETKTRGDLPS